MADITAIVTAYKDSDGLKYTLEGLVEQSTEDFEVIVVDNGATKEVKDVIKSYCDEYVGFSTFEIEHVLTPVARNAGVQKATTEFVIFIDENDYISPDTIAEILKTAEETKADIISPRYYISGENEPYYDQWSDMLATVPTADVFDTALLNTFDNEGRAYKKKFFDLYSLSFPDTPVLYNTYFLMKCVFGCKAKVSGCAGAIYDKRNGTFSCGFSEKAEPSKENFNTFTCIFDEITEEIKSIIKEETGALDGDEFALQEIYYIYFSALTNRFYRYFWYLSDELIGLLREKYEELSSKMVDERKKKLNSTFSDLRFPGMYVCRADAAKMPMFSLLADFSDINEMPDFIESLYLQKFPFFEIYIRESDFTGGKYPERWKTAENLHILPDANFFSAARADCSGIPFNVKNAAPLDPRILSEMSLHKAPKSMLQYVFASKRKQYATKSYLKRRGLAINS